MWDGRQTVCLIRCAKLLMPDGMCPSAYLMRDGVCPSAQGVMRMMQGAKLRPPRRTRDVSNLLRRLLRDGLLPFRRPMRGALHLMQSEPHLPYSPDAHSAPLPMQ